MPLGTIDLGSFAVLSDHGDAEDDGEVDEFFEEATGIMPLPPLSSWSKNTETLKRNQRHCRKFRKSCNGDRIDEESQFFDCWDGKHEQSDALQQIDRTKCEKLSLSELPCLFCVSKVGCVQSTVTNYSSPV